VFATSGLHAEASVLAENEEVSINTRNKEIAYSLFGIWKGTILGKFWQHVLL
jgi:hypothetical protein